MRKLMVVAAFVASAGMLLAQHGGGAGHSGGGSFGHSGGGSFGHASAPAMSHFSGSPRSFAGSRPAAVPRGYAQSPRNAYRGPASSYYPGSNYRAAGGAYAGRRPDRNRRVGYGYARGYGYPYGYPGFDNYWYLNSFLNSPLDLGSNDPNDPNLQSNYAANDSGAYAGPYEDSYPDPPMDSARPPYDGGSGYGAEPQAVRQQPKVQLIFKDGHKLEIQDYVATRTRILVTEGGRNREILVASLDVPATLAANQAAGVDFSIPGNPAKWTLSPEDLKTY